MSEPESAGPHIYSVGEVLAGLRALLEERIGWVWVVGELSNLHRARSGHLYFTLKDDSGQLRAALFRSAARRLAFEHPVTKEEVEFEAPLPTDLEELLQVLRASAA